MSEWTKKKLCEIVKFTSGGTPSKQVAGYWGGDIPWVSAKDLKSFYISDSIDRLTDAGKAVANLVDAGTILILVRGMSLFKDIPLGIATKELAINQDIKGLKIIDTTNAEYLAYYLSSQKHLLMQMVEAAGHGTGKLDTEFLKDFSIKVPLPIYQNKIVAILKDTDHAIETTERLIAAKERYFDGLLSRIIHKEIFPKKYVNFITREVSVRNRNSCERVLSVTNKTGFVLPEDQFERRVASENVSNYKLVRKGQYAYNPSRINVGSIARLDDWDEGILSPMYTIFELDTSKVNSDFFLHWLSSHHAKQRIKKSAQGSVRETVSFDDFGAILIPLPSLDEQQSIADILNTAKREIDLLRKLAESYRIQKRGLMQKLLSGEWRVAA